MKKYLGIGILLLIVCSACNRYDIRTNDTLDIVAQQMNERPDSSLMLLRQINPDMIRSKKTMAYYALLYTQAKDKNYIDETDPSLINVALEYYSERDNAYRLFLSHYYNGRILYNGGHYTQAMLSYTKAEELADAVQDNYAVALLYAQIGIMNKEIFDYNKSLSAFCKAAEHYEAANKIRHKNYTDVNIGQLYLDMKQYDKAEPILSEKLRWAFENGEPNMCRSCVELLGMLYEAKGDEKQLVALYESPYMKLCDNSMIIDQSMAYVCAHHNQIQKAQEYLKKAMAEADANNVYDICTLLFKEYKIHKRLGNYRQALESYEKLYYIQDTTLRNTLQHPIISAQKDYYQSQLEYKALKLKYNKQFQIMWIAISFIAICVLLLYIRHKMAVKNDEIGRYMDKVQNLENSLFTKNTAMDSMAGQIKDLFMEQFAFIDKLSSTYYETHGAKRDKEAIYTQVKKEIEKLQGDRKSIQRLESIVNKYMDNVMQTTREEMTTFTETDFRLLCYLYAGFSAKTISVFTNDSIGNIYMKKSRLKAKIAQSNLKNKDSVLRYL